MVEEKEKCSVARDRNASFTLIMFNNPEQKRRQTSNRSTAVPMDFEFTNRPSSSIKPAWSTDDLSHTPQKRMTHCLPLRLVSNLSPIQEIMTKRALHRHPFPLITPFRNVLSLLPMNSTSFRYLLPTHPPHLAGSHHLPMSKIPT